MSWLTILLRALHVVGGVLWAGGSFFFALFLEPTATSAGPEGGRFVQRLVGGPYPRAMAAAGMLSVVAGIWLFWLDSGGFQAEFLGSRFGVVLSIGGLCGLLAAVVGLGLQGRNAARMQAIVTAMQGQAGGPSAEQLAQLQAVQRKLRNGGRTAALLLAITVLCMAIARYV
jgi:uncharacterized membrane protein